MTKLNVLVVDDEPLAIQVLCNYINQIESLEVSTTCRSATQAFNALQEYPIELMFLDIHMPELSGVDFLKSLKDPPKVIFTTAYQDYAVESYELEAVDYLLKPISFDRFLKSVNKVMPTYNEQLDIAPTQELDQSYIYLKSDKKVFKVKLSEIVYVESLKDYLIVHTDSSKIVTYQTISNLHQTLPVDQFLRIHRSYIVALERIQFFSANLIGIAGSELPVGRTYKESVLRTLKY